MRRSGSRAKSSPGWTLKRTDDGRQPQWLLIKRRTSLPTPLGTPTQRSPVDQDRADDRGAVVVRFGPRLAHPIVIVTCSPADSAGTWNAGAPRRSSYSGGPCPTPTSSTRSARRSAATAAAYPRCARTTSPPTRSARSLTGCPRLITSRSTTLRRNQASEDNRMCVCCSPTPDERPRLDDQPALRVEPRRSDAGKPDDRIRRRRHGARGWRRVDESRAVGDAQAGASVPRGHEQLNSTTLGWRMVNPEMPDAVDDFAWRERREARWDL